MINEIQVMEEHRMKNRTFWFDARNLSHEDSTMTLVNNLRFKNMLLNANQLKKIKKQRKMNLIAETNNDAELSDISSEVIIFSDKKEILKLAKNRGNQTACFTHVRNQDEMENAWKSGYTENYLIVELDDETNIPVELLIARLQKTETKLLKAVKNIQEAEVAFGVMEKGCDGVLIQTENAEELMAFDKLMSKDEEGKILLEKAKVIDVQHVGMGYRVCVDTTTIMTQTEGMIVGSTSSGGLLVSSETHYLPYMELRPFRVNAGAIHSYILAPNNMTAYLSEIKSGSELLCVDIQGNTRKVSVGRSKTELRPLLKIEAQCNGITINAIVQDDWHIRIFGGDGKVKNASRIEPGDEVLAYISAGGRHVGIQIDENLSEK